MKGRTTGLLFVATLLGGCSLAAYTPVIATSATGLGSRTLNDQAPYRELIERPILLRDTADRVWTLRRFSGGRHFIELSSPVSRSTPLVCRLSGRPLTITKVFEDTVNGGTYFSATTSCGDGQAVDAPRNHWLDLIPELATAAS